GIKDEVLARRELRHWIVGKAGQKNYLVIRSQILDGKLKYILIQDPNLAWQMITKPEEIHNIDFVTSVKELRYQDASYITASASDQQFHNGLFSVATDSSRSEIEIFAQGAVHAMRPVCGSSRKFRIAGFLTV